MKPRNDGYECPKCGGVFWILQAPWPHMGEWERYMPPRHCPHCGAGRGEGSSLPVEPDGSCARAEERGAQ